MPNLVKATLLLNGHVYLCSDYPSLEQLIFMMFRSLLVMPHFFSSYMTAFTLFCPGKPFLPNKLLPGPFHIKIMILYNLASLNKSISSNKRLPHNGWYTHNRKLGSHCSSVVDKDQLNWNKLKDLWFASQPGNLLRDQRPYF